MMTKNGAKSSAIIYSIVETAKENNLKVYEYLKYLFEELPKYDELTDEVLESHMPWSPNISKHCKMSTSSKNTETLN